MDLIQYVRESGKSGRYEVRIAYPAPLRAKFFAGRWEFKRALHTRDKLLALRRAAPLIAGRRTPSIDARSACVMENRSLFIRSPAASSRRAARASVGWKPLQNAVWVICDIRL